MDFEDFYPDIKTYIKQNKNRITYTPDYNQKPKTYMKIKDRFVVAGVQYSDYQKVKAGELKVGTILKARLDRNNPHDPQAIALYCGSHRIGYVPKGNLKTTMIQHREAGISFIFKVTAYNKNNPTWQMITVEVTGDKSLEEVMCKRNSEEDTCERF